MSAHDTYKQNVITSVKTTTGRLQFWQKWRSSNLAWALQFEGCLCSDNGIKGISRQREIDFGITLWQGRRKHGGFGYENRSVATSDEAVMEEETESTSSGGRVSDLLWGDGVGDDLLDAGTGAVVVVGTEEATTSSSCCFSSRCGEGEEEEEEEAAEQFLCLLHQFNWETGEYWVYYFFFLRWVLSVLVLVSVLAFQMVERSRSIVRRTYFQVQWVFHHPICTTIRGHDNWCMSHGYQSRNTYLKTNWTVIDLIEPKVGSMSIGPTPNSEVDGWWWNLLYILPKVIEILMLHNNRVICLCKTIKVFIFWMNGDNL